MLLKHELKDLEKAELEEKLDSKDNKNIETAEKGAGTEVEVLVFISSLCILTTNISIAKYVNYIYGH